MQPALLILAAGMGSRYGGLKQLDGLGPHGETIMDYSVYDALRAGFGKIVFVIRKDFENDFREKILVKYQGHVSTEVVFQNIENLPDGYSCPPDRLKPWGPSHAILMAKNVINQPFAVINSDDFYGSDSYKAIAKELVEKRDSKGKYCMVGFRVGNTMTENGGVNRGVCHTENGFLKSVTEARGIAYDSKGNIVYDDSDGLRHTLDSTTPVSMNLWGFTPDYFEFAEREFKKFLDRKIKVPNSEQVIPDVADALIKSGEAVIKVLDTDSKWFGVTYAEDRNGVIEKLSALHASGEYPENLFS